MFGPNGPLSNHPGVEPDDIDGHRSQDMLEPGFLLADIPTSAKAERTNALG